MVRNIMKNPLFLMQPSTDAVTADRGVADDLRDTLVAHSDECVGMAQIIQHEVDHCNGVLI